MKINRTDEVIKLVKECGCALISSMKYAVDASEIGDAFVDLAREIESSSEENKNLVFNDGEFICKIEDGALKEVREENTVMIEFPDKEEADEFAGKLKAKEKTSDRLFAELGYEPVKDKGGINCWKKETDSDVYPHSVSYIGISSEAVHKCGCMVYADGKSTELMDSIMSREEITAAAKFIEEND